MFYNFISIKKDGFKDRLPEILQKQLTPKLINSDGEVCHHNIVLCKFNTSSKQKVYVIGDSHVGTLLFNLKDRIIENDFQFISSTFSGCIYFRI